MSKQLLPIYDKPMVYYPLSVLMLAGIRDILVITAPGDTNGFQRLLGDGSTWGLRLQYVIQDRPEGIAQAFILGEDFIGSSPVCLILGDNLFFGHNLPKRLYSAVAHLEHNDATLFAYHVQEPKHYGVVEFDKAGNAISITEKPKQPKSNYAVTGLYFYPNDVVGKAHSVKPSDRGELEITSINQMYLTKKRLKLELMGRGYTWLDAGTHESLLEASFFVETIEKRQGLKIACLEEIAYEKGYITRDQLNQIARNFSNNQYGKYLRNIVQENG